MVMSFANSEALQPTLWRTCRVLANKTRLRIIRELYKHPNQMVSDIAHRLNLSLSLTSQSLRALNARGLILARRTGRFVYYRPSANQSIPYSVLLLKAILKTFANDKNPEQNIFQYSTAFTHPRRILIIKTLGKIPMLQEEIAFETNIPISAVGRHLRKLVVRGFIKRADCRYACAVPQHEFAQLLQRLARYD